MFNFHFVQKNQLKSVKATILFACFAGIVLSLPLWLRGERLFPAIRPAEWIPALHSEADIILLLLALLTAAAWIITNKTWIGIILIGTLGLMLSQDQMRWQPWMYLYLLMLLPFMQSTKRKDNTASIIPSLQWIIAGVYVWSGIQKLHPDFIDTTIVQTLQSIGLDPKTAVWRYLGYIIPFIEILTGFALLSSKFRKQGIFMAVAMHVLILIFLSPFILDHNTVVYPWNAAMIAFVLLLFYRENKNLLSSISNIPRRIQILTPLLLIWIFPIFNLFGYWDHYLSCSLYSGKPHKFFIAIEETEVDKINPQLKDYFIQLPGLEGGHIIDMDKWTFGEMNVPFYPQRSLFKKISTSFCSLGIAEDKLIFLERSFIAGKEHFTNYSCATFASEK